MSHPLFFSLFRDKLQGEPPDAGGLQGSFIRLERRLDAAEAPAGLLGWIMDFDVPEHFYFAGKEGDYEVAGLGSCEVLRDPGTDEAEKKLAEIWRGRPDALLFGGVSFFEEGPAPGEWDGFGSLRFTLPLVEMVKRAGEIRVAVNGRVEPGQGRAEAFRRLSENLAALDKAARPASESPLPKSLRDDHIPERPGWDAMMGRALGEIGSGGMEKAVLSRKRVLRGSGPWPALEIARRLSAIQDDSFVFLYKISRDCAFLGRSPERLLRLSGRAIRVDAIAGTRQRGVNPAADGLLARELLDSKKELWEHRIVSDYIGRRMAGIASNPAVADAESILKLQNVQHIVSRHSGTLRNGRGVISTLRCFHPTPAVGGHPTERALSLIRDCEPHERGWFAAPIGWMNGREADFAVGIRSALVRGDELHVFAGAGIVKGSEAGSEWLETEQKMRTITGVSENL